MPLKLASGMMESSGDEALLIMQRDVATELVRVTKEALLSVADPPLCNECRLQEYIDVFSDIASQKFDRAELGADGRVEVTAGDVSKWKAHHRM